MKHFLLCTLIVLAGNAAFAQFRNIQVDAAGNPNEPHIAIDPRNPAHMVAGANMDNVYQSFDGGFTWNKKRLTSTYGVWGDPIIMTDTAGSFYFFHLSNTSFSPIPQSTGWIDRMVCQRMDAFSGMWSNGGYAGLDQPKHQDKPSVAYDSEHDRIYLAWTQFDHYGSADPNDSSLILLSTSSDRGVSWSGPVRVNTKAGDCIDEDGTVEGAVPAIGLNYELYLAWASKDGIVFKKSLDSGKTWPLTETRVDSIYGGWAYDIPGLSRCNGLPFMSTDLSNSANRGNIYINWSDQRRGVNNTDVWLSRSTDGGNTWGTAVRVNDDTGTAQQFMSSMTVDQATGYIYVLFYDRRNAVLQNETDVYMAVSRDGGLTFSNEKVSETPFRPIASKFFGDYTSIAATNGIVRPVWARMDGGQTSIWTAIPDSALGVPGLTASGNRFDAVYPNPFTAYAQLPITLKATAPVSVNVIDVYGRTVAAIQSRFLPAGNHSIQLRPAAYGLVPGTYFVEVRAGGERFVRKVVYAGAQ